MNGARRAGAMALLVWLAAAALWPAALWPLPTVAQDDPDGLVEVGSGPIGERTMSIVGRSSDDGTTLTLYGYLTALVGLGPEELFGDADPAVDTARFTIVAEAAVGARDSSADVTTTTSTGELRVYFDDSGGARWDDPASFADGEPIATFSLDLHETRQNQAPGVGVVVGDGRLIQQSAAAFDAAGARYHFGVPGIEQRLRYVGAQAADSPSTTMVALTGSTSVVQRESIVVVLGSPGAAATPAAAGAGCTEIEAWLAQTSATLSGVQTLGADISPALDVDTLDGQALRTDVSRAAELVAAQRDLAVPEPAADAHRLAVTAASTSARGLQLLADAAQQGDAELLALGQAALQDGAELAERAAADANEVAATCGADGQAEAGEAGQRRMQPTGSESRPW